MIFFQLNHRRVWADTKPPSAWAPLETDFPLRWGLTQDQGNDWVTKMIVVMMHRWFFQFNRQLQADPSHPWQRWPGQLHHSEQASGSEGGDASQDQGPLRLQELEAEACHHDDPHCLSIAVFCERSSGCCITFWFPRFLLDFVVKSFVVVVVVGEGGRGGVMKLGHDSMIFCLIHHNFQVSHKDCVLVYF